jgi:hypothetical protein
MKMIECVDDLKEDSVAQPFIADCASIRDIAEEI